MILDFRKTSRIEDPGSSRVSRHSKKENKGIFPKFKKHEWKNAHRALLSVAFILGALLLESGGSIVKLLYYKNISLVYVHFSH